MKLIDMVANMEISKTLNHLGIDGMSLFSWVNNDGHVFPDLTTVQYDYEHLDIICPAYNSSELIAILPTFLALDELGTLVISSHVTDKEPKKWNVGYYGLTKHVVPKQYGHSINDAMARMLILLIENKHLLPDKCNTILNAIK